MFPPLSLFALLTSASLGLATFLPGTNPSIATSATTTAAPTHTPYPVWYSEPSHLQVVDKSKHLSNLSTVLASLALGNPKYLKDSIAYSDPINPSLAVVKLWNRSIKSTYEFSVDPAKMKDTSSFLMNSTLIWPTVVLNGFMLLSKACNSSMCGFTKDLSKAPEVDAVLYALFGDKGHTPSTITDQGDIESVLPAPGKALAPLILQSIDLANKEYGNNNADLTIDLDPSTLFYVVGWDQTGLKNVTLRETKAYSMSKIAGDTIDYPLLYMDNNELEMPIMELPAQFNKYWRVEISA